MPPNNQLLFLVLLLTVLIMPLRSAARHLVTTEGIRPDAVLLDLNLPDSQGVTTVKRCQSIIDTPIVVFSGQENSTGRDFTKRYGRL